MTKTIGIRQEYVTIGLILLKSEHHHGIDYPKNKWD